MHIDPSTFARAGESARTALALAAVMTAAALTAAQHLAAQTPDTLRQDTVYEIEPIAVRAVRPSATPGGVSAIQIRLDSVRFQAAPLLEHVLRELPLVQVRTNSRGQAQLALRGAAERQIAILLDGVPLTLGWDHRADLSVIPLTAARSVRVVRGLSSILHGPNVLGGVVEIGMGAVDVHRVEPLRLAAGVDQTGGYSAGVAVGTAVDLDDSQLMVRAGLGRRARDGLPAPADLETVYPALAGDELRANSYLDHTDGFGSVRYSVDSRWLAVSTTAFRAERGTPPELNEAEPRLWRYPEMQRSVTVLTGGFDELANPLGLAAVRASVGVDVGATSIHDFAVPADPSDPATGADDFYTTLNETEESEDRTLTVRLRGNQQLGDATVSGAATVADVLHDEVITYDVGTTPNPVAGTYRQRLWSVGAEVDLPFSFSAAAPFTGGRASGGLALDGASTLNTGDGAPGPSTSEWGGRLGLSVGTTGGGLLLHTAVSRKGRFPALREMYSAALGKFEPNPDLDAEVLTVVEAGFTSGFDGYDLQVVGFHQRVDNAIVRTAPPEGSTARYQRINRDLIRSSGVEIMAGYTLGRLALETEVTLQDVEVVEPGTPGVRAEYEPAIAGGVGGTIPLVADVEVGAEVEYWGQQFCSAPRPGQEAYVTLEPSTRTDIQVARTFRLQGSPATFQSLGVELAIDNVGDTAVYDQCGLPQPGRALRLQIRLH